MKKNKLIMLVLAALALSILLILLFAPSEGSRYGESPLAPAPAVVAPARPVAAAKSRVAAQAVKRRKQRVSRLREPGEAMGGGEPLGAPPKTTATK